MNRCRVVKGSLTILAVAAIIASCGGSDNGAAPASTIDVGSTASTAGDGSIDDAVSDDEATNDSSNNESGDESDDDSDSGSTVNCDAIFSMAEMEEFFAEPVELTEEANDSVGQLVCTWESIEDPDDLEDLAFQVLIVQFYSGSPVEASAFFDPTMLESVTTIEGIGDVAYASGTTGMDYFFVDEPVGGSLGYVAMNMGDAEAEPLRTSDDVEQLFRTFHERVT